MQVRVVSASNASPLPIKRNHGFESGRVRRKSEVRLGKVNRSFWAGLLYLFPAYRIAVQIHNNAITSTTRGQHSHNLGIKDFLQDFAVKKV